MKYFIDTSMAAPSRVKLWDHLLYCCTAMILMELLVHPTLESVYGIPHMESTRVYDLVQGIASLLSSCSVESDNLVICLKISRL